MSPRMVFAAALALAAAAGSTLLRAEVAAVAPAAVQIDNFTFKSAELHIARGTRVVWTNRDDIPHTVTADGIPPPFRSHALDTGETYAMLFDKAGVFHYYCSIHPKMRGTVIVQ